MAKRDVRTSTQNPNLLGAPGVWRACRRPRTKEYRLEAVRYYGKAKEADPEKTIKDCARELGTNGKAFSDWVVGREATGRVGQARSDEQRLINRQDRRIKELEPENEFPEKAAALFARRLA